MKRWCNHIRWRSGVAEDRWEIVLRNWAGVAQFLPIPRSWKQCPICHAERPSRANIKAAELRATMDAGDGE